MLNRTLQEFDNALVAEWRLIPQNRIQTLITSMRRRCSAVIDAVDVIRVIRQVFHNEFVTSNFGGAQTFAVATRGCDDIWR